MKSKKIISFLYALIGTFTLHSQISPNTKYDCNFIELNKNDNITIKIPFNSISIIDARPDTFKAGYYYKSSERKEKVCFKNDMANHLSTFLNSYIDFDDTAENSIICYVKRLWFGTYDTTDIKENKITIRTKKLMLKIEFYQRSTDCYSPLYRFDSTFNMEDMPGKELVYVLGVALKASVRKLTILNHQPNNRIQCLLKEQIDSFNKIPGAFLVLKETVAQKGAYMTINDFKNNQPTYADFRIKFTSAKDAVFIKGKIAEDTIIKPWAVSDGKKMYIRMGENYFELIKSGNNYDFYGFDTFFRPTATNINTPLGIAVLTLLASKRTRSKPFQVNLETGEVY